VIEVATAQGSDMGMYFGSEINHTYVITNWNLIKKWARVYIW
jgi:hypothetical protein